MSLKAIGLKTTCPRCGEEVELVVTKRQLKALLKGMKASSEAQAELIVEKTLGRDKLGDLRS